MISAGSKFDESMEGIRSNAAFMGFRGQPTQTALLALLNARTPISPSHVLRTSDSGVEVHRPDSHGVWDW